MSYYSQAVVAISSLLPFFSDVPVSPDQWNKLSQQVGGRLYENTPFASPCFHGASQGVNGTDCSQIESKYTDEVFRANSVGAYINTQWETCQATGAQCLLDFTNPSNADPIKNSTCKLGSVSSYYIDVKTHEDVSAAFAFAKSTKTTLVIKNTGHDYKGRSSAPDSLALWTHNLKNISYSPEFVPEGCTEASAGVTVGAGVQWGEAYAFAEANNITLVGGSDKAVGISGGWLQGGGHSLLSNTMGLGVDRVLEFKIVTPDGQYRTANRCQNKDLFYALRGGGGGTFGVVLESTTLASPQITVQAVLVKFSPNATLEKQLFKILVDNGVKWADETWGGIAIATTAVYITPKLSKEEAAKSMAPLIEFGHSLVAANVTGAQVVVTTFPSYGSFFSFFASSEVAVVGANLALTSRLIPRTAFADETSRASLVSAVTAADTLTPGLILLMGPPTTFKGDGLTSITDAWRSSIYHVTVVTKWNWNATNAEKREQYALASRSIDHLRKITPDAAYVNEADVYEPNHEVAFWGDHYEELLQIKHKYDPDHLLDCWHCVGWNRDSARFSCYL